jgi:hypothetical protein
MRVFSCTVDVWESVTGQTATEFRLKGARMRTIKISQVVNRKAQQIGQQFAFRGPDAVEMGEIRYSLREDCKHFMVRYMSIIPI